MTDTCPHCGSNELIRKGYRKTKTLGRRPIRRCRSCNRKFTAADHSPRPVSPAVDYAANLESLPGTAWAGP